MEAQALFQILRDRFGDAIIQLEQPDTDPIIRITPESLDKVGVIVKSDGNFLCNYLMCITGVDIPPPAKKKGPKKKCEPGEEPAEDDGGDQEVEPIYECAVLYHLYSTKNRNRITLKVQMPRDGAHVSTVTHLWKAAEWHEREVYDLLGIVFDGHPDLRRILLPDDWEGYPLRKDYAVQEFYDVEGVPTRVPRGW